MKKILLFIFLFYGIAMLRAQSLSDGIFMDKKFICAGVQYNHDAWKEYWEGTLLRENGNIGTVTTQSAVLMANYGILDRLNVIAMMPYVWTKASQGTLAGQRGLQDLTLGLKFKAFETDMLGGKFSVQIAAGGSLPVTNYVADFLPMSIGMQSKTLFGRGILHLSTAKNLSFLVSGAYMLRDNVEIDRPAYYTTHQIYSNEVEMPNAAQLAFRGGHYSYRWAAELIVEQNLTLGGFDIRRQDMPFVSNNMDMLRVGGNVTYRIPFLDDLQVIGIASQAVSGRNVGKSFAWSLGLTKFFGFGAKPDANTGSSK